MSWISVGTPFVRSQARREPWGTGKAGDPRGTAARLKPSAASISPLGERLGKDESHRDCTEGLILVLPADQ